MAWTAAGLPALPSPSSRFRIDGSLQAWPARRDLHSPLAPPRYRLHLAESLEQRVTPCTPMHRSTPARTSLGLHNCFVLTIGKMKINSSSGLPAWEISLECMGRICAVFKAKTASIADVPRFAKVQNEKYCRQFANYCCLQSVNKTLMVESSDGWSGVRQARHRTRGEHRISIALF